MSSKLKKIGVLTSGGDAPGMNAAVRSVVRSSVFNNIDCYGIYKGYEGLISDDLVKLNARGVNNIVNNWLVICENKMKFVINQYRYIKCYNSIFTSYSS